MSVKTILFDFDGTVADTNDLIAFSHMHVLEQYLPGEFSVEDVQKFNGPPLNETYKKLLPEKMDEMIVSFRSYNEAKHDEMISAFPGVIEGLRKLKTEGFQLGIFSVKSEKLIARGIVQLGMEGLFEAIVGKESVTYSKPNPEGIFKVVEKLDANLSETIMVGDSPQDILAAQNAGIPAVLIGWTAKGVPVVEELCTPDLVIDTMSDLINFVEA